MKTCIKCGIQKENHDFSKKRDNLDGLNGSCRECSNAANKLNYIKAKLDRAQQTIDFLNRKVKV